MIRTPEIHLDRVNKYSNYFKCVLCEGFVSKPQECLECGNMYCHLCSIECIRIYKSCKNGCAESNIVELSKSLFRLYCEFDVKCRFHDKCGKSVKVVDLEAHELACQAQPCTCFSFCENVLMKNKVYNSQYCSPKCYIFDMMRKNEDLKLLKTCIDGAVTSREYEEIFAWEPKLHSPLLIVADNKLFFKEGAISYSFSSALAPPVYEGKHYWEIELHANTENDIKLGVSTSCKIEFDKAFSDFKTGFAYYGVGQLRHDSDSNGGAYGAKMVKKTPIGMLLDMTKGTLCFKINSIFYGAAFQSPVLKQGPIYPAIALLKKGGCTIRKLPIPSHYK